jgi:hypothetical protein
MSSGKLEASMVLAESLLIDLPNNVGLYEREKSILFPPFVEIKREKCSTFLQGGFKIIDALWA